LATADINLIHQGGASPPPTKSKIMTFYNPQNWNKIILSEIESEEALASLGTLVTKLGRIKITTEEKNEIIETATLLRDLIQENFDEMEEWNRLEQTTNNGESK